MKIKTLTRIKFTAMIIVPILAELTLVNLEYKRIIPLPGPMFPVHAALYAFIVVSAIRYRRRCYECGRWQAVKETSREEINRMEHPSKKTRRKRPKRYQVRINVYKQCKHCGKKRMDETIKEIKEK